MKYALGLSLEGRELKTALVSRQGKKISVEFVHSFALDEEGLDPFKLLGPILTGKQVKIISGLSAADVILRDLQLPMTLPRKILSVLPFQAETLIPFPAEETLLHPHICKKNRKASRIFLSATKKEKLSSHLSVLHTLRIDPDQVSTSLHALARWISWAQEATKNSSPYAKVAYLGRTGSFFLFMEKGRILSAKLLSFPASSLGHELKKADEFIQSKFKEERNLEDPAGDAWILAGDLPHDLPSELPIVSVEEPFTGQRPYALAIGLALEALATDTMSVQWRQGIFSPLHVRKKQRTQCLIAVAAFLFAAAVSGPLGHSICNSYEKNLLQRAHVCLERVAPQGKKGRHQNPQDLDAACLALNKRMIELKKEEHLGAFAPKVSELLAWLSTCIRAEEEGKPAALHSLNYLLDPNGKVEVTLSLQAPPHIAEAFLKKLRCEESLVDSASEIVWKKEKSSYYTAQFFIK